MLITTVVFNNLIREYINVNTMNKILYIYKCDVNIIFSANINTYNTTTANMSLYVWEKNKKIIIFACIFNFNIFIYFRHLLITHWYHSVSKYHIISEIVNRTD